MFSFFFKSPAIIIFVCLFIFSLSIPSPPLPTFFSSSTSFYYVACRCCCCCCCLPFLPPALTTFSIPRVFKRLPAVRLELQLPHPSTLLLLTCYILPRPWLDCQILWYYDAILGKSSSSIVFWRWLLLRKLCETAEGGAQNESLSLLMTITATVQPSSNEWRYPRNNHNSRLRKNQKRWIERPGRRLAGAQAATMRDGEWWPLIIRAGHSRDEKEEPHQHEREREKKVGKNQI